MSALEGIKCPNCLKNEYISSTRLAEGWKQCELCFMAGCEEGPNGMHWCDELVPYYTVRTISVTVESNVNTLPEAK